jgi:hypothetical protein
LLAVFLGLAAVLASTGEPSSTSADTSDGLPLQLSWTAPMSCPDANSERAEIRRRVGSIDRMQVAEPIVAEAKIRTTATGTFQLSLRTLVGKAVGERELSGQDCRELADAAALVLALLINPQAAVIPDLPPAPPPTPPKQATSDGATDGRIEKGPWLGVGLGGVLGYGVLPGLAEGLDLRFIVQHGRWAAMVRAGGFLPKGADAQILPHAHASFYRLESALAACAQTLPGHRVGLCACLGGGLVRLHGESSGVSTPGEVTAFWPEALAEVSGHMRLTPWARLRLSFEGHLGHSPDFAILGLGSVYRPTTASLRGALGFDVLF